jgi:hypothetical protein
MGMILTFEASRSVGFADDPERPLGSREVRLRTLFSGISAGTKLTAYRGTTRICTKAGTARGVCLWPARSPAPTHSLVGAMRRSARSSSAASEKAQFDGPSRGLRHDPAACSRASCGSG